MPDNTESIIADYWDDLPREMRVALIQEGRNTNQILDRAARELGLDYEPAREDGHVRKEDVAQFAVLVMEEYGDG